MQKKRWKKTVLIIVICIAAIIGGAFVFLLIDEAIQENQTKTLNSFDGGFDTVWQQYEDKGIDYVLDIKERYPDIYRPKDANTVIPQEFFDKAKSAIQQQSDTKQKMVIASVIAAAAEPLSEQNYGGFLMKASDIITYDLFEDMRPDEYFELLEWDKSSNNGQCFRSCFSVLDWPKYTLHNIYNELNLEKQIYFRSQFFDLTEEQFDILPVMLPDEQPKQFSMAVENAPINRGGKVLICRSSFGFVNARDYLSNWSVYDSDMCALAEAQRAYSIEQADYVLLFQTTYKEGRKYDVGLPSYTAISTAYIFDAKTGKCVYSNEITASPPVSITHKIGDPIAPGDYAGAGKLSMEDRNQQFDSILAMINP